MIRFPSHIEFAWKCRTHQNKKGHRISPVPLNGGGGNRTRVPQHFHAGIYVCSPIRGGPRPKAGPRSLRISPTGGVGPSLSVRVFSNARHRIDGVTPISRHRDPELRPKPVLSGEGSSSAHGLLRREGELRFSSCDAIGLLRGRPINLDTPPCTSDTRSIPNRPRLVVNRRT